MKLITCHLINDSKLTARRKILRSIDTICIFRIKNGFDMLETWNELQDQIIGDLNETS